MQLEVRPDAGRIEKPLPFPDRLRIEALLLQRRFETLAVVGSRNRETVGVEKSEGAGASQIRDVEPSGLLGANRHYGQIEIRYDCRAVHRRQHAQPSDDPRCAVEVAALRHAVEVRTDDDARCAAVPSRQRHRQVPNRIDRDLEPHGVCGRPGDVMSCLLAGAIAVAHDAAAAARRAVERFKQRSGQVEIGLDRTGHGIFLEGRCSSPDVSIIRV